jgi:hypothetical protein
MAFTNCCAAAANVNPRTRLSHMTLFLGRDWCTRERCQNFPEFTAGDSQNFATGSRFSQDFPRKSDGEFNPGSFTHPSWLCRPCAALSREPAVSGLGSTLLVVLRSLRGGSPGPLFSLVVRAAAAKVNPRTRLSHMTLFSGRDWCTRERCRLMMQNSWNSLPVTPRILRRAREFPRIFRQCQTTPGARPHHPHPHH